MNGYGDLSAFGIILIIFGVLGGVFSIVSSIIYLCYFMSSDDRGKAWCPKLVVIFAFALAVCSVFLLPLDVANTKLDGGLSYAFQITWQVFYGFVAVFVVLVIPFFIFYYESEDPEKRLVLNCTEIFTHSASFIKSNGEPVQQLLPLLSLRF